MKPIGSVTTGLLQQALGPQSEIGTQPSGTGVATRSSESQSAATSSNSTPWLRHLTNSATISDALKTGASLFRPDKPPMTAQQLSSLRQLAEEILDGRKPDAQTALKMATTLCGCFRSRDFADAKVFAAALGATFQQYPEVAGRMVVDPVNGLPSTAKFAPALAEVRDALRSRQNWAFTLRQTVDRVEKANATV